jgi:hypothetical protein
MAGMDPAGLQVHASRDLSGPRLPPPSRDPSLTRVRRGVYVDAEELRAAGHDAPYLARVLAVAAARREPILARESALTVHGIPCGLAPASVFTIGDASTARNKGGVTHAVVALDPADVTMVGDLRVCTPEYALADLARRRGPLVAVAAVDWALRWSGVTKEGILDALERQSTRGRMAAAWAVDFADGAAESVGESYSRVRLHELGFAMPELQARVVGRSGKDYRVDMRWRFAGRRPLLGEFDGMQKYGELATRAGSTGAKALQDEKVREDDLRFGADFMRWIWADMIAPRRFERLLVAHGVPRVRRPLRVFDEAS